MFALDQDFGDLGHDLSAQASDLITVIETFGLDDVHVVGLCGGAPIALAAAGSKLIRSLSLWHGDYELGAQTPKTAHQQDMQAMLAIAGTDRAHAAAVHKLFQRAETVDPLPGELAHYLLYPYATVETLYRYALLNDAIMTTDCRPYVVDLDKNCLVVTSANDTTAHPEGSVYVSERLPHGRLCVLDTGDHLTAFGCQGDLARLATAFILENS